MCGEGGHFDQVRGDRKLKVRSQSSTQKHACLLCAAYTHSRTPWQGIVEFFHCLQGQCVSTGFSSGGKSLANVPCVAKAMQLVPSCMQEVRGLRRHLCIKEYTQILHAHARQQASIGRARQPATTRSKRAEHSAHLPWPITDTHHHDGHWQLTARGASVRSSC